MSEKQQWYIFTFGVGQRHSGHYVKFYGTYEETREQMFAKYGREWAFQYSESQWFDWVNRCVENGTLYMLETELKDNADEQESTLKVVLDEGAYPPERAHKDDAGLDLRTPKAFFVRSRDSYTVDTGVHVAIPKGFVGLLKSRSGLNIKHDLTSEGVIDAGYTGSIRVKMYNNGDNDVLIEEGNKITQLVIVPIIAPKVEIVNELKPTERGDNGFGSTGK